MLFATGYTCQVLGIRIYSLPTLLAQKCELVEADLTITVRVHEPIDFSHVIKADFQPQVIECLSKFIDGYRLRMIRVDVSESLSHISESLVDLRRNKREQFDQELLISRLGSPSLICFIFLREIP